MLVGAKYATICLMIAERIPQLKELTREEKLILADELWDEAAMSGDLDMDHPELVAAIQERLEFNESHRHLESSWEDVKARIQRKKRDA